MAYNLKLANRIRSYLDGFHGVRVEEKEMFKGLAFMVNGKMCINVSGDHLMCRYDPVLEEEVAERNGFIPMIMKGKQLRGYCYVSEEGFKSKASFEYWLKLCLDFNARAKASKRKKKPAAKSRLARKPWWS